MDRARFIPKNCGWFCGYLLNRLCKKVLPAKLFNQIGIGFLGFNDVDFLGKISVNQLFQAVC